MKINGMDGQQWIGQTIATYLEAHSIPMDRVVVEVSGTIVPRDNYLTHRLLSGDRVEIVQFVGGG